VITTRSSSTSTLHHRKVDDRHGSGLEVQGAASRRCRTRSGDPEAILDWSRPHSTTILTSDTGRGSPARPVVCKNRSRSLELRDECTTGPISGPACGAGRSGWRSIAGQTSRHRTRIPRQRCVGARSQRRTEKVKHDIGEVCKAVYAGFGDPIPGGHGGGYVDAGVSSGGSSDWWPDQPRRSEPACRCCLLLVAPVFAGWR